MKVKFERDNALPATDRVKEFNAHNPGLNSLPPAEYHKNCHDCGRFLKKDEWVRKDDPRKAHGLCRSCFLNYDNPWDY